MRQSAAPLTIRSADRGRAILLYKIAMFASDRANLCKTRSPGKYARKRDVNVDVADHIHFLHVIPSGARSLASGVGSHFLLNVQVDVPSLQTESMRTALPHELIFQGVSTVSQVS